MEDDIAILERATARLLAGDQSRLDELARAAAERARAAQRLALRRDLDRRAAARIRAAWEAGEAALARIRHWRAGWQNDLASVDRARRYVADLRGAVRSSRSRINIEG